MKKTSLLKSFICFFGVGCLFLFNFSCGLDVYEFIEPPSGVIHSPEYDTDDYQKKYFHFWTKEKDNANLANYKFLGTDVYYKIYNNLTTMNSERSTLQSLADSENSTNSADRMISSYSYQRLVYSGEKDAVLIPATGENKKVYIRLSNYLDQDEYSARICIGEETVVKGDEGYIGVPVRSGVSGNVLTFDFGRDGQNDAVPIDGDGDVKYSSTTTEEGKWYVQLFAVAVAQDTSFTPAYSSVCFIGAVTIDSNVEDN